MNKSSVEAALKPYLAEISRLVLDGFDDYRRDYSSVSHTHHARTRASIIHDHIFAYAKDRLLTNNAFHLIPTKVRNLLDFSGSFVLQFKKLSRRLRTSNIPTQLALDFARQKEVHCLPGIPPRLPRLAIGYVPSANWTSIDGIFLTYAVGNKLEWFIDLTGYAGDQLAFPNPDTHEPPKEPARRVIRAKVKRRRRGDDTAASI